MRIAALSDLHGWVPYQKINADILLLAGDIVPDRYSLDGDWTRQKQAAWLRGEFTDWLNWQDQVHAIVAIAGNHDILAQDSPRTFRNLDCDKWAYLEDESVTVQIGDESVKIHGSPWTPRFGGWAWMDEDENLYQVWDKIPQDIDILMTHGPAYGWHDEADGKYTGKPENVGSRSLRHYLLGREWPNLKLYVFGHIHPAWGYTEVEDDSKDNPVIFANVSYVNPAYEPHNPVSYFDI